MYLLLIIHDRAGSVGMGVFRQTRMILSYGQVSSTIEQAIFGDNIERDSYQ